MSLSLKKGKKSAIAEIISRFVEPKPGPSACPLTVFPGRKWTEETTRNPWPCDVQTHVQSQGEPSNPQIPGTYCEVLEALTDVAALAAVVATFGAA